MRLTAYIVLGILMASSVLQGWKIHQVQRHQAIDAKLLALADAQRVLSQEIGRIAEKLVQGNLALDLGSTLAIIERKSRDLQETLVFNLGKFREGQSQDNFAKIEHTIFEWQTQNLNLIVAARALSIQMNERVGTTNTIAAEVLQSQALRASASSQALLSELQYLVQVRRDQSISTMTGQTGFHLLLLVVLVFAILEPMLRLISRQQKKISDQATELDRFSLVAEHIRTAVIVTNDQGQILWLNSALCLMMGQNQEEIQGQLIGHIWRHDLGAAHQDSVFREAIKTGENFHTEILVHTAQGQERCIQPTFAGRRFCTMALSSTLARLFRKKYKLPLIHLS